MGLENAVEFFPGFQFGNFGEGAAEADVAVGTEDEELLFFAEEGASLVVEVYAVKGDDGGLGEVLADLLLFVLVRVEEEGEGFGFGPFFEEAGGVVFLADANVGHAVAGAEGTVAAVVGNDGRVAIVDGGF